MKKKVALLMATLMVGSTFAAAGCGGDDSSGFKRDETKTLLKIANLDMGIGRAWIIELGRKFEEAFANYSFEEGKVGVQVDIEHHTRFAGEYAEDTPTDANYVFFTESVDYARYSDYMADLSDVMTKGAITGVDENGEFVRESKTVAEKIDGNFLSHLNVGTEAAPEYRAMPYYLGMRIVNYDTDLWNDKQFYFAKGGCPSELVVQELLKEEAQQDVTSAIASYNAEIKKLQDGTGSNYWTFVNKAGELKLGNQTHKVGLSAGPDGKYDTFDDGLPATYDEFYLLCNKMVSSSVTPFIWSGASPNYAENLTRSLFQNDAGVDTLNTFYSLKGTMDDLVKIENGSIVTDAQGKPVLESYTFNGGSDDGYNAFRMNSLYNALQFVGKVVDNPSWTDTACYNSTTMVDVQSQYLTKGNTASGNRVAMLLDGTWWQQEATLVFSTMEQLDSKYSKQNRNFGVLPLPDSTIERHIERIENDEKLTFVPENDSYVYLNTRFEKDGVEMTVTKTFLSYISNDDCILSFMENTNMLRPLMPDYSKVDQDRYDNLSSYSKLLIEFQQNSNVVYPYTKEEFAKNNQSIYNNFTTFPNAAIGQQTYPIRSLKAKKPDGLNSKLYFEGVYKYFKENRWSTLNR
ncbi:MAG: hypothetical protein J6B56_03650 [Clostridia bacterium]|nr:hypothetical protein [Clostridia bacterium]